VDAGITLVQIREPRLPDPALLNVTSQACALSHRSAVRREAGTRIVVNDRLDVALAGGADGVHLRANSFSAARVRERVGTTFLVGRSVHDLAEAMAADRDGGCDYLLFGTVFQSRSKPEGHRVAGLEALQAVCQRVSVPVIAIGGITRERAADVSAAGAAGIAAIGLFEDVQTLRSTAEFLRRSFDT
jgi:thiamine-phosphate pyrophosphorylase